MIRRIVWVAVRLAKVGNKVDPAAPAQNLTSAGFQRCPDGPSTTSCTSSAGAIGMMQVMPFHVENTGENLRDAETNIRKGVAILAGYISYMGEVRGGLAAYNAGPTGASNGGGWGYADKVLDAYQTFKR